MDNHIEEVVEKKDKGFTLVELLIVIVILGILATVTVFAVRGITDKGQTSAALVGYEEERRPATTQLVLLNRQNGPEQVMQLVEERAPVGFKSVTDVLTRQELEDVAANYKKVAGFQVETLNAKPPIVPAPPVRPMRRGAEVARRGSAAAIN